MLNLFTHNCQFPGLKQQKHWFFKYETNRIYTKIFWAAVKTCSLMVLNLEKCLKIRRAAHQNLEAAVEVMMDPEVKAPTVLLPSPPPGVIDPLSCRWHPEKFQLIMSEFWLMPVNFWLILVEFELRREVVVTCKVQPISVMFWLILWSSGCFQWCFGWLWWSFGCSSELIQMNDSVLYVMQKICKHVIPVSDRLRALKTLCGVRR